MIQVLIGLGAYAVLIALVLFFYWAFCKWRGEL
jgi:hypothetical protein